MKDKVKGNEISKISFSAQRNHRRLISNVSAGFSNNPADTNLARVPAAPIHELVGRYATTLTVMIDYRPARLVKAKDRWYFVYYQTNPVSKILERFRCTFDIGRYPIEHRLPAAIEVMNRINLRLPYGFPFDEDFYVKNVSVSLRKAFEIATDSTVDLRHASKLSYAYSMRKFLKFAETIHLADQPVEAITKKVAISFSDSLNRQGLNARSHNNDINEMRRVFNILKSRELIAANPFDNVPKRREAEKLRRTLAPAEMETILAYCYENDKSVYLSCVLLFFCLIRPNEQRFLKKHNFNLEYSTIEIPGQYSKNRKTQVVTIPDQLKSILIDFGLLDLDPSVYVIGPRDKLGKVSPIGKSSISNRYREIIQELYKAKEIPDITGNHLYSWKDTGATAMRSSGIDPYSLQEQGRWHSLSMVQKYLMVRSTANESIRSKHLIPTSRHQDRNKKEG